MTGGLAMGRIIFAVWRKLVALLVVLLTVMIMVVLSVGAVIGA